MKAKNIIELVTGLHISSSITEDEKGFYLTRALSNISSIAVNFGFVGLFLYSYFIAKLGDKNPLPALAIFFYGFNFYYLTGWPIFPVFIYLIAEEPKHGNSR